MNKYEIIDLPKIAIIGQEGFCTKEKNEAQNLWEQANLHFKDVANIGMKNPDGSYVGFWGAMSDETMSFKPWTDDFSRGLYLAGIEVYEDTKVPAGWVKWIMPARKYLVTEVDSNSYEETFKSVINHLIPKLGMKLAGAVCDFTEPATMQNKLFFPVMSESDSGLEGSIMDRIIAEYEGPYLGFDLSHDDHIEGYTIRKLSSGDYEIYVQEGNRVTGAVLTTNLYKNKMEGKTYEEVVEMLPESGFLRNELLNDKKLKLFLGFFEI